MSPSRAPTPDPNPAALKSVWRTGPAPGEGVSVNLLEDGAPAPSVDLEERIVLLHRLWHTSPEENHDFIHLG